LTDVNIIWLNKSADHDLAGSIGSNSVSLKGTISMTIYLYVKTYSKTGLKYLGQTSSNDPHKYPGSGMYWKSHLKKHGLDYTTEILKECQTNRVKRMGNILQQTLECSRKQGLG
jgi:hypothetical protein